ncbi:MAG: hypothetical protein QOJ89_3052 [bacterium]|jgi:hypothetical protein
MSSGPRLLDVDLLDQFEAILRAHRIGIVEAWAPGLTDEQIDEAIAGTDLQLPDEVRTWWRHHNGLVSRDVRVDQIHLLPSNREPMSLQNAVACYRQRAAGDQLLLVVNGRPEIQVACCRRGEVRAPVYWDRYDDFVSPEIAARSLGELILVWMSYIERGVYAVDPDGGWAAGQPLLVKPPDYVVKRGLW